MRRLERGLLRSLGAGLLALLALLATVLLAPAAGAHAYLESSNPSDGATLAQAPHELRLGFSEHVVLPATRIRLTDGHGRSWPVTRIRVVSEDAADTESPSQVVGVLPDLPRNTYRLTWETLSSDDLHRTSGVLVFGIGTAVRPTPFQETAPLVSDAALVALVLLGLAVALGAALADRTLAPARTATHQDAGRLLLRRTAVLGAAVALAASLLGPVLEALAGRSGLGTLLGGSYGVRWGVRETGLALVLLELLRAADRRTSRAVLAVGALAACTGIALLGHAVTTSDRVLRVTLTAVHLAAALTWTGAVACLVVVLLRERGRLPREAVRAALRGFARPAGACAAVTLVTGIFLAGGVIGSVDALLVTTYGRTLLVKLGLAAIVGALALVNHRRLRGRSGPGLPLRTIVAEAAVAGLVLAASAVLVSGQPATEPQLVDLGPAPTAGPLDGQVADLQVSFDVRPDRPGDATGVVTVYDTRRPSPGPVLAVTVATGRGRPAPAAHLADGTWAARLSDLSAGTARVQVRITRSGAPTVVARYAWTVPPAGGVPRTIVSRTPLRTPLTLLAGLLAGALLVASALVVVRRRRRARPPRPGGARTPGTGPAPVPDADAVRVAEHRGSGEVDEVVGAPVEAVAPRRARARV